MTRAIQRSWNWARHLFALVRLGYAPSGSAEVHWKAQLTLLRALSRTDPTLTSKLHAISRVAEAHGRPDFLAKVGAANGGEQ